MSESWRSSSRRRQRARPFVAGLASTCLALVALPARGEAPPLASAELGAVLESAELLHADNTARRGPVWDHTAGRASGRENSLRLRVSRADDGAWRGVDTRAELRFELLPGLGEGSAAPQLRDLSSFVGVAVALGSARAELRVFPFDTDYVRVGWLHALDWGGTDRARRESVFLAQSGAVPGLELSFGLPRLRLFSAIKWASVNADPGGSRRLWGALGGGSWDMSRELRLDAGFGYFQRPRASELRGFVEGASLRAVWHRGPSEPELAAEPLRPAPLRSEPLSFTASAALGVAVALEGVTLVLRQRRFEDASAERLTWAPAAALSASFRGVVWAFHAAFVWRSLAFVVRDDTRVAADQTLPVAAAQLSELSAWLGGSVTLPFGLVPALELGLELPAALRSRSQLQGYAQTFVAGGSEGLEPLPLGSGRLPVLAARLSLRLPLSRSVAAAGWVDYVRDANASQPRVSTLGVTRQFAPPDAVRVGAALQARF